MEEIAHIAGLGCDSVLSNSQESVGYTESKLANLPGGEAGKQLIQDLVITIEHRAFNLRLENLDPHCVSKIVEIFEGKTYDLEGLLTLFITNIRMQSLAEVELGKIIQSLK